MTKIYKQKVNTLHLAVRLIATSVALGGLGIGSVWAQTPSNDKANYSAAEIEFFENKVRPLLAEHCLACHGQDSKKIRGGLHLTSRKRILAGGDSGAAINLEEPNESLLIRSVRYEDFEMPPQGKLKDSEIETLVKWIEMGAPDPRQTLALPVIESIDIEAGKKFWSFQPRSTKTPAEVEVPWAKSWIRKGADTASGPIDQFIAASLASAGIEPVADASRQVLIRRAYFALIGLPPTVQQIEAFEMDQNQTQVAFAKIVDQLLQSRHFGERWGRHWLDVVRFAESSGGGRSLMFKDAWRFRDYVIDSYNKDKPFDQFVKEQIAGDLLPFDSHEQNVEQVIGSGFLALGPTNYEQQDKELLRMEVIDEQVDTVGRSFLGMTLGCARCHDHKFDPIPMSDYYALAGIFGSTKSLVDGNVSKFVERSVATNAEVARQKNYKKEIGQLNEQLVVLKGQLKQLGVEFSEKTKNKVVKSKDLSGLVLDNLQAELTGAWTESAFSQAYVDAGYLHDSNQGKGQKRAVFSPKFENGGQYEVRLAFSFGSNRASNVPVTIDHQDGKTAVVVNQSLVPPIDGLFVSLGNFRFEANNTAAVTIETTDTDGHVIVDAVQFLKIDPSTKTKGKSPRRKEKVLADETNKIEKRAAADLSDDSDGVKKLKEEINKINKQLRLLKKNAPLPGGSAMSVRDEVEPTDGHIHIRGSVRNLGPVVKRGFISVCCSGSPKPKLRADESGRVQLADWIASPQHPLTARVYVNRIWRHLFGKGLVETTDNFGLVGQKPSHPELLDYLANQLIENGWSTKKLIRQIMLSRVYGLSSEFDDSASSVDVGNRLLWRANRRRIDAEVLRDSILFVSGELDLEAGGLTIRKLSQYDFSYEFKTVRRSVYVPAFRNSMLDLFEVFDFANPNLVVGDRNTSTLPTQALFLMNSPKVIEHSRAAALRLLDEVDLSDSGRVSLAYRRILGRKPKSAELAESLRYISSFDQHSRQESEGAWSRFCHALIASLDFRYVE